MAVALRVQYEPGWTTTILYQIGIHLQLQDTYTKRRQRKHDLDCARKVHLKYKKQKI